MNDPHYETWLVEVKRQATNAGVTVDEVNYDQTLQYLYLTEIEPGNAVKRYVDTRIRMNAITENPI